MAKNDKKSKIDEIVKGYFEIFEEDLGFSSLYSDNLTDEEVTETIQRNFEYFKAGFLFANIDTKQVLNEQNALDFYFFMVGGD